jgi:hypothetical protein
LWFVILFDLGGDALSRTKYKLPGWIDCFKTAKPYYFPRRIWADGMLQALERIVTRLPKPFRIGMFQNRAWKA